jgi:nodulation protein E
VDAGIARDGAIVTGSCVGGQSTEDIGFQEVYKLGHNRVHPLTIPKTMANAGASHISMEFGITGPSFTISTACSSAGHAIGQAFQMIRTGQTDLALTGGSEATFSFGILKAWEAMRVVSPDTCRPFSKDRRGMILGEGGAMLVLEPLDAAVGARRADPRRDCGLRHVVRRVPHYAAFLGWGRACHAGCVARWRASPGADRIHQRARYRHGRQR